MIFTGSKANGNAGNSCGWALLAGPIRAAVDF